MKPQMIGCILACLIGLGLGGCGLDVVEFDVVETGAVGMGAVNFPGMQSFATGLGRALSNKDVDPGDIDSMRVLEVRLRMTSQGGLTQDLRFFSALEFWAEAEGMTPARIAFAPSIEEGVKDIVLTTDDQLELKPFLQAGDMLIRVEATLDPIPPDLVELEVTFKMRVDVSLT